MERVHRGPRAGADGRRVPRRGTGGGGPGRSWAANESGAVEELVAPAAVAGYALVYGITKALWNDNTRTLLDNGHAKGKQITLDTALDGVLNLGVPLHPGAERFYREQGLIQ